MRKLGHLYQCQYIKLVKEVVMNALIYLLALLPTIIFVQSAFSSSHARGGNSSSKRTTGYVERYKFDQSKKLEVSIGIKSQTRISFDTYTIKEVVGDSNKYKLISSSNGSYVFIAPKTKPLEKIDISVIASNGKAQDLLLNVTDGYGKSIIIESEAYNRGYQVRLLDEAKNMLKSMIRGKKSKYDVIEFKDKSILFKSVSPDIEISKTSVFRYDLYHLVGVILEVRNIGKYKIECDDINLKNFFNKTLLISFSPKHLAYYTEDQLTDLNKRDRSHQTKCLIDKAASRRAYIVMQKDLSEEV